MLSLPRCGVKHSVRYSVKCVIKNEVQDNAARGQTQRNDLITTLRSLQIIKLRTIKYLPTKKASLPTTRFFHSGCKIYSDYRLPINT